MITDLRDALVAQLELLTGEEKPFQEVFDYVPNNPEAFPCLIVTRAPGSKKTSMDNMSDYLQQKFYIYILARLATTQEASDAMYELIDDVLALFNTKENAITLNGAAHNFVIENWDPFQLENPTDLEGERFTVSIQRLYQYS